MNSTWSLPLSRWRSLDIDLLRIYDGEVRRGGRQRPRQNNAPASCSQAWFLREGSGEIRNGDLQRRILKPGYWIFPSKEKTWQDFSEDARLLSIHYRARWADGTFLFDVGEGLEVEARRFPELEKAALNIEEVVRARLSGTDWFLSGESMALDDYLTLDGALHGWLLTMARVFAFFDIHPTKTASLDERVERGLQWLDKLPLNTKFLEKQLAGHLGLSVVHLNRLFTREVAMSPVDVWERKRLAKAVDLMRYSHVPVKQAAYDLGFSSPSHFIAWFRSKTGKTPRDYRKLPGPA